MGRLGTKTRGTGEDEHEGKPDGAGRCLATSRSRTEAGQGHNWKAAWVSGEEAMRSASIWMTGRRPRLDERMRRWTRHTSPNAIGDGLYAYEHEHVPGKVDRPERAAGRTPRRKENQTKKHPQRRQWQMMSKGGGGGECRVSPACQAAASSACWPSVRIPIQQQSSHASLSCACKFTGRIRVSAAAVGCTRSQMSHRAAFSPPPPPAFAQLVYTLLSHAQFCAANGGFHAHARATLRASRSETRT